MTFIIGDEGMANRTLDSILASIGSRQEIDLHQDIIFEGNGKKDSSGKVVSQHEFMPVDIAKIASKIKKPKNWKGRIILLGSQTAELTEDVSYEYYKLTNKSVTVVGPKDDLIIEYINDNQTIIGVGWNDSDPERPDYIDFAKKDIYALDKLLCGIQNKLNNFNVLFNEYFESILPDYKNSNIKIKLWFKKLLVIKKVLIDSEKYIDYIIPSQDLDEDSISSWKEVLAVSKSITSLLISFSDESKYIMDDTNDMLKLLELNDFAIKLEDIQKETLPHLFAVAENLFRIFNLSMIKESLDLSDPDMVSISTYIN